MAQYSNSETKGLYSRVASSVQIANKRLIPYPDVYVAMKQKQVTQAVPEGRVKQTGKQGGVTVTVDVGHKSEFDYAVTSRVDRMISTYKENTIVDYSDSQFDWSFVGQNIETIIEETTKQYGDRLAETTIVIADIETDADSSVGFNIVFAITAGVMNAVSEL